MPMILAIGMEVNIQFEQQPFRARLVTISPEILNNQVTGRVRFTNETPKKLTTKPTFKYPNNFRVQRECLTSTARTILRKQWWQIRL